ncbi:MAG: hypothetical protein HDT38_05475 [Clostridiales bacterium]|nr:hypothetical protein [Clostridiales bacterium]
MRKTEAYELNLIDMDDTFSPEPINENTQKLEAALTGTEDRLAQRLTTLEGRKIVTGTYVGTFTGTTTNSSSTQTIELGFTPTMVLVCKQAISAAFPPIALPDSPALDGTKEILTIVPGGFTVRSTETNRAVSTYHYLAIL